MSSSTTVAMGLSATDEYTPVSEAAVETIVPFCACLCCLSSCYTTFPGCIGCSGMQQCLCCYSDYYGCKIPRKEENVWCDILKGHAYCAAVEAIYKVCQQLVSPLFTIYGRFLGLRNADVRLIQQRAQLFCLDVRCAVPLAEEIPRLVTCCFFTVYLQDSFGPYLFYKSVQELEVRQRERAHEAADAATATTNSTTAAPQGLPSSPAATSPGATATGTADPGTVDGTEAGGEATMRRVPSVPGSEVHPSLRTHSSDADEVEYYP